MIPPPARICTLADSAEAIPLGCVLAGGQSTRMGRDKALLPFRRQPLIKHAVEQLRTVGCQVAISAAAPRPDLEPYAPVLSDLHPGCGPLSGIEAALLASPAGAAVLFLAVDLPLVPTTFLALLLERAKRTGALATVPLLGSRPQPLCAVYHTALLPAIQAALQAGEYKVMRALQTAPLARDLDFFAVEALLAARSPLLDDQPEPLHRWFANINTPHDLLALPPLTPHPLTTPPHCLSS